MKQHQYKVIVSNVGLIYSGNDEENAKRDYDECVNLSQSGYGRFSGEDVTMFEDGEIVQEYHGTNSAE